MKKLIPLFIILFTLVNCGGQGGKTLVTINGKDITESDLDLLGSFNPRIKMQLATPFGKKQILDNLVEQELLYQSSIKKGLQRDSKVKAKIDLYKRVIISQAYVDNEIEKAVKEYYDQHKEEFEKLQMSHIMVKFAGAEKAAKAAPKKKQPKLRSEAEALKLASAIKARLDKGEDFAKIAKEVSEDTFTKNNGGDLGRAAKSEPRLERRGFGPLMEKAFTMKVGEIAGPIKSNEGYHIITLTKGVELEPFDEVKQGIAFKMQGDTRNKLLADLKNDAKIVYAGEEKKEEAKPEETKSTTGEAPPAGGTPPVPSEQAAPPQPAQSAVPQQPAK